VVVLRKQPFDKPPLSNFGNGLKFSVWFFDNIKNITPNSFSRISKTSFICHLDKSCRNIVFRDSLVVVLHSRPKGGIGSHFRTTMDFRGPFRKLTSFQFPLRIASSRPPATWPAVQGAGRGENGVMRRADASIGALRRCRCPSSATSLSRSRLLRAGP